MRWSNYYISCFNRLTEYSHALIIILTTMPTDLHTEQQLIRNETRSNIQWIYVLVTQQYRIYNLVSLHINYNQSATTHAHTHMVTIQYFVTPKNLQVFVRFAASKSAF